MRRLALVALLSVCSGCSLAAIQPSTAVVPQTTTNWHLVVTDEDRIRLRDWRETFTAALAEARTSGHSAEIAGEGALLQPDAAIAGPAIPDGLYRCRTIKLGSKAPAMRTYAAFPASTCEVVRRGKLQSFARLTGTQREVGTLYPSDGVRQVFLGTLVLSDESRALHYRDDQQRDVAGYMERIGPDRWRLMMPAPHFESKFDVMELVPER